MVGTLARTAGVVDDLAVLERDVEVDADEDLLACRIEVADGELVHGSAVVRDYRRAATNPTRSATRQL